MPFTVIVLISSGAVPMSVMRLFVVVIFVPLKTANGGEKPASCDVRYARREAIQLFTAAGFVTEIPAAANAANFASMSGFTVVATIGPSTISFSALKYWRRNGMKS